MNARLHASLHVRHPALWEIRHVSRRNRRFLPVEKRTKMRAAVESRCLTLVRKNKQMKERYLW